MRRVLTIVYLILFTSVIAIGQTLQVEGTITDTATGKPIPNAIVTLKCIDTTIERHADANGKYRIATPDIKPDKLYIVFAHTDSPLYGTGVSQEAYFSTFGLKNSNRRYLRNIELTKNVGPEPVLPTSRVYFRFEENKVLAPEKDTALNSWLRYLLNNPTYMVEISGFSDPKDGSKMLQMMAAKARSQECIDYMHSKGVSYDRMKQVGYGSSQPLNTKKEIRSLYGKDEKLSAEMQNCRAEIKLRYIFYNPVQSIIIQGNVSDMTTGLPIFKALIQLYGSDGTKLTTETDALGMYNFTVSPFNPLVTYSITADAIGYDSSDPDDVFKVSREGYDQHLYEHNFRISKHGFETQPIFPPVPFDSASSALSEEGKNILNRLKSYMDQKPGLVMEFMGDADWREPDFVNLASARARACGEYLSSLGINSGRFVLSNRLNQKSVDIGATDTPGIVVHKENKTRFNYKACNVSMWPINWSFSKDN